MAVSDFVTLGCLPNRIPAATITSGSDASSDLAAANVQSDIIKKPWRCGYRTSRHSWLQAAWIGNQAQVDLESIAYIGNQSESALYRYRIGAVSAPAALWERMPPTGRVSYSRATADDGASAPDVTEIDEDCDTALATPDGGTRLPPGSAGANVIYSFGAPSVTCLTGVAANEFRVIAGLQAAGSSDGLNVALFEAGVAVSGMSWTVLNEALSTTLREYVFQWDAGDLADSAGTDVEIRLSTGGDTGTIDILIEAVEWNQYPTGDGGATYDSGVLSSFDTFASSQFGDAALSDGFSGISWTSGGVLTSEQADSAYVRIEIWDRDLSSRKHATHRTTGLHDETWKAVEVGNLRSGPIFVPTINAKAVDTGVNQYGKRTATIAFQLLPRAEMLQNVYMWGALNTGAANTVIRTESGGTFVRGRGGPFCVLFVQPNETGVQTLQNFLCRIVGGQSFRDVGVGRMSVTLNVEEW